MADTKTIFKQIDEMHDKLTWEEEQIRQQQPKKYQSQFDRVHGAYLQALREGDAMFIQMEEEHLDNFINAIPKEKRAPFIREMNIRRDMDALVATKEKLLSSNNEADLEKAQEQMEMLHNLYIFRAPLAPKQPNLKTDLHSRISERVKQEIKERKKNPREKENVTPSTLSAEEEQAIAQQKAKLGLAIPIAPKERIHPKFDVSDITQPIQAAAPGAVKLGERTGHILTLAAQNYVRKLQLEGKAPPNTFIDNTVPPHQGKLNFPVFIGKHGEPIALYNKATKALGKGAFGEVYLGINIDNGKVYAVKKQESGQNVLQEEEILKDIHVFVDKVGISGTQFEYGAQVLAWGTDIEKYLTDPNVSYEQKAHVFKLALEKLNELHESGYVHRDIKMANLMYDPIDDKVVVIDVGLAGELQNGVNKDNRQVGTKLFMPKEIIDSNSSRLEYSAVTDLYSAGIMGAFMLHTPADSVVIDELMAALEIEAQVSPLSLVGFDQSNIRVVMEQHYPELKAAKDKQQAIQTLITDPNFKDEISKVWPSYDMAFIQKALTKVIETPVYDMTFHDINRQFASAKIPKAEFMKNLPKHVKESMPDIFSITNQDPLKQAVNNMLQLMCSDHSSSRPDFKAAIDFFAQVEKQFELRKQGALGLQEVTPAFAQLCQEQFTVDVLAKANSSISSSPGVVVGVPSNPVGYAEPPPLGGVGAYTDVPPLKQESKSQSDEPSQIGEYFIPILKGDKSLTGTIGLPPVDPEAVLKIEKWLEDFKTSIPKQAENTQRRHVAFSFWGERDALRARQNELVDKILKVVNPLVDKETMTLQDLLQIKQVITEVRFENLANKQIDIEAKQWSQNEGPLGELLQKVDQRLSQELEKFPAYTRGMQVKEDQQASKNVSLQSK